MLLKRFKNRPFDGCGCTVEVGMPESWCCRGWRCCSELALRFVLEAGRASMKLWMEPLRRGAAEVAEEKEERRRRVFCRVKGPVTVLKARERELECECCEATPKEASLTASSAIVSLTFTSW